MRNRLDPVAWRAAWRAHASSRVLVLLAGSFGAMLFAAAPEGLGPEQEYVHPFGSGPLSGLLDFLVAPFVRADARWYLTIAELGYEPLRDDIGARPAFFPVYPLLIKGLGGFGGDGAAVVTATLISLAAFLPALYLVHRLITLELGETTAGVTVWLLAFSPMAFYFSAPYTESLYLLLSVGALYAARTGRWLVAGALAGVASATRPNGVLLVLPLAMLYFAAPGKRLPRLRRPQLNVVGLALAPAGLLAYSYYLAKNFGDWTEWRQAQYLFGRVETVDPFTGLRRAVAAAYHAIEGDVAEYLQFPILLESAFFVFAIVATVGVFRLMPAAYGVYCAAVLIPSLIQPVILEPLASIPRFTLSLFPLYAWVAHVCLKRGVDRAVLTGSASGLALLTAAFATWHHLV
jgi:hypothetical protein